MSSADAAPAETPYITSSFWFREEQTADLVTSTRLRRIMFEEKSPFQHVQVVETGAFGKTLVLDGKTQSALSDEFIYHESLVHPSLLLHPNPKTVFIGGGGELATAREVLRHKSVERVVMVDIDEMVVKICHKELPEWGRGAMEDPRLEVHYTDAYAFLESDDTQYDVIIMDIADPIEAGPGIRLYTQEFFHMAKAKLSEGGVYVTQSGPGSVLAIDECFTTINRTLATVFDTVVPYTSDIPSFGMNWGFNLALSSADGDGEARAAAIAGMAVEEVNALIAERISGEMRFYDGLTHRGIFGVPKPVRDAVAAEKRVMTVANPVFMF